MDDLITRLRGSLMAADREGALDATRRLLEEGEDPTKILQEGMASAMLELGARWNRGEVYLPEVVAAAELFKKCNELVEPSLPAAGRRQEGHRVVMATVKGDLHDLGKNMVGAMMKTAGFEVHDLGKDIPTEAIVEAVKERQPAIVGLSALLTTTVPQQRDVIAALERAGLRGKVKVLVGGAPVTREWAAEIGADGFAPSAPLAVSIAQELLASVPSGMS